MQEEYRDHRIQSTAKRLADNGRWQPHVVVTWPLDRVDQLVRSNVPSDFATELEAQVEGLRYAKDWIDGHLKIR